MPSTMRGARAWFCGASIHGEKDIDFLFIFGLNFFLKYFNIYFVVKQHRAQ